MMQAPLVTIGRGDSVMGWEVSAETARPFAGEPAPASDPQNYRYINGFVDIGDLPCRVATWAEIATRDITLDNSWPTESLLLPGTNRRVEFSQFRYIPTRLSRWCRTRLRSDVDRYCSFDVFTRGGVHIWVDGVLAARFEPFTRNSTEKTQVHLPLKAEGSEVVVFTEDMAERDTNWFFELVLVDNVKVDVLLPGASLGSHVTALQKLAAEARMEGDYTPLGQDVTLLLDTPMPEPIAIHVKMTSPSHTKAVLLDRQLTLPAGATRLPVCAAAELPEGFHNVTLTIAFDDTRIERRIACAVLHSETATPRSASLADRKAEALLNAARTGEDRMGTVLAMLATGEVDPVRLRRIVEKTLVAVRDRHDCADFETPYLLWIMLRHAGRLPADLRSAIREALLGFRYWVDEPGNDVMWFWSENHALCFHTSQLLAGLAFPDDHFSASGRTGREQLALGMERLGLWFDSIEHEGLAEWNSAAYYPVDFIGLLALAELAPEPIAGRARRAADRIFLMMALHTLNGVAAGSMGRAYDKELQAGSLTELAPFATVAFGKGWLNRGVASLPMFAAGAYEPPAGLLAHTEPPEGTAITAHYAQGCGPAALLSLYKTRHVQLSCNTGARPGGYGHQQHVIDVLFSAHSMARSWINHPGEDDPFGQQRPSYWAGNGVLPRVGQQGNTGLVLYDLGASPRLPFTHVYAARSGLTHHLHGDVLILSSGDAMVGYKATSPIEAVTTGPCQGIEYRVYAKQCGWLARVVDGNDVDAFRRELDGLDLSLSADGHEFAVSSSNAAPLTLSWGRGLLVGGILGVHPNPSVEPLVGSGPAATISRR